MFQLAPPLSTISLASLEHTLPKLFLHGHKPMFTNFTSIKCELALFLTIKLQKNDKDEAICRAGIETETENGYIEFWKGRMGRTERVARTCIHYHV